MKKGKTVDDHVHEWKPNLNPAQGFFSKRGDGSDAIWYIGVTMQCVDIECEGLLFVPSNKALHPVECLPATTNETFLARISNKAVAA